MQGSQRHLTPCHLPSQGRALSELRSLEETSASLVSAIQEGTLAKRQLLDDLIEAERQIMLSERKIQLEKEMQVGLMRRPAAAVRGFAPCTMLNNLAGAQMAVHFQSGTATANPNPHQPRPALECGL